MQEHKDNQDEGWLYHHVESVGDHATLSADPDRQHAPAQRAISFFEQVYSAWEQILEGSGDLIGLSTGLELLTWRRPGSGQESRG